MLETGHAVAAGLFPLAISYAPLAMLPGANFAVVAQAGSASQPLTRCRVIKMPTLKLESTTDCDRVYSVLDLAIMAAAAVASDFKTTKPAGLGPAGSEPAAGNPPASALA